MRTWLGIDIGGTAVKIGVVDESGDILLSGTRSVSFDGYKTPIMTTVSMLAQVLQKGGMDAQACGNIGTPMLLLYPMKEEQVAVAEISSFQMETLNSLRPHIAIILNITEDHLNRHYNMENYLFLKRKLLF